MAAVRGAGTTFAGHEVVAVFGLDFITADVAADCVADAEKGWKIQTLSSWY